MRPLIVSRCKVTKSKFGTVRICRFLSEFVGFRNDAFSRCKVTKKDFGTVSLCQFVSVYVTLCHFVSLYVTFRSIASFTLLYNKGFILGENGLVSRFNSGDLAGKCADFNSQQKIALRAENNCSSVFWYTWGRRLSSAHLRNFLQVLDLHIFRQKQPGHWAEVVCHFHLLFHDAKLQKVNLALSAYVRKCPLLSAFLLRCKVTQKKIVTVQLCPAMSICVHLCPATA